MYKGLFIDDQKEDDYIARYLSSEEQNLFVDFRLPNKELLILAEEVIKYKPAILALDYRLDEKPTSEENLKRYKAGPLAQQLRDQAVESPTEDFPIILVSHESKIRQYFEPDLTVKDLFDRVYTKESVTEEPARHIKEIISLIKGYSQIIKSLGFSKDQRLMRLLDVDEQENSNLDYQDLEIINGYKAPHQIARDIFKKIIDRQGLLLDKDNVIAVLGIDPESADVDNLLAKLTENKISYSGVFSDGWDGWWAHRISNYGKKLCGKAFGNLNAEERAKCLNNSYNLKLSPAKSRWTARVDSLYAFACSSCRQPTEIEYSVQAYEPISYDFMQKKRICWTCVQTGEYAEKNLQINTTDMFIAKKIQKGEIKN
jgi:hypothetical protein